MFLFSLIPVVMGAGVAMQTAVNSRLSSYTKTPFMASAISFTVGSVFLALILLLTGTGFGISAATFVNSPWWLWTVGITGAFSLTVNILLFSRLGSIQTAVLPIVGQIIMGVIIDQFGLFYSPVSKISLFKLIGLILALIGMFLTVVLSARKNGQQNNEVKGKFLWQLLGIFAGMIFGIQTAINGRLGVVLHSPVKAALFAFLVGAIILIAVTFILRIPVTERLQRVSQGLKEHWWIILGGVLGGTYIFLSSWLVPQIGTGEVVVISLFGQLLFSAVIDQLGLFNANRNTINWIKILGLLIMFVGVICIRAIA